MSVPSQSFYPQPGRNSGSVGSSVAVAIALVALFMILGGVAFFLWSSFGTGGLTFTTLLALIPLGICLWGLRWVDRWDPEPRVFVTIALLWGAGASVALALLFGDFFSAAFGAFSPFNDPELFGALIQAPVIEEISKGLGVLLIFHLARSHFDGPIDGIVYGGLVGAGFAFTENILYFMSSFADHETSLVQIFVLRGLFSPFAHVLFTAWIGFMLGLSLEHGKRRAWLLYFLAGLIPAMVAHFFWNGGLGLFFDDFFSFYFLFQMPLFIVTVLAVWYLRRLERKLLAQRLGDYATAGWLSAEEVQMFTTPQGRRSARAWAAGGGAAGLMRDFTATATRLGATRHRIVRGHALRNDAAEEQRLLQLLVRQRQQLFAQVQANRSFGAGR
ncbi:PrsW family intramembrane metalloprotease [Neomicrococcus aestuarii]|uniref:RsiW-degrading membrane proteinase PrsW (M82 family) n=1 Tax=Neomicrococcus aestuarii TaxID=556325 RepID=A0A1L2ZLJ5_9MICC|nr:PrsW family intramembrane metalloprotease [Neomicrococcus aestuarii]APF40057.1 hypothetical protein BHE16_02390 [Neomicrococcus aestuarii]MBB5512000.1 RsiW-degrading membrane proteinase PrsW (M82 family) [Neomicrococcus aestuarii]